MKRSTLRIGLCGAGRLGSLYAGYLSRFVPRTELSAIADTNLSTAQAVAAEHEVKRIHSDPTDLVSDPAVDAIVIVTPTHTHPDIILAAFATNKPVFCEKPVSTTLKDALKVKEAVTSTSAFLQVGMMRRFDPAYLDAAKRIQKGEIGVPCFYRATSRDPFAPGLEFLDPAKSGGLIVDMGLHDIDLARSYLGPVSSVSAIAGTPLRADLKEIGDYDTAVISLEFKNGGLGVIDLCRHCTYGYDVSAEILGTEGALRIGYLQQTPLQSLSQGSARHDIVPYFAQRFREAYIAQLRDFVDNVLDGKQPGVTLDDSIETLTVALAARESLASGKKAIL